MSACLFVRSHNVKTPRPNSPNLYAAYSRGLAVLRHVIIIISRVAIQSIA